MKYLLIFSLLAVIVSGCDTPVCCDPGPPNFFAVIRTSEGTDYLTSNAGKPIDLYYDGENKDDEKTDVHPIIFLQGDTTKLECINITSVSMNGIKTFYLKVGSDIDTLYVDVDKKRNFKSVHFNGQPAQEITSRKAGSFWLMKKK
ncbi:hypothetical protein [Pontibacter ramchanderi]|uniref:Lipoprotein n=1 Tax=Pontibacter ramchanderi TaxID=1179743 RepID=A0A2N3U6M5_9BACT|nr:hypothetical protein [Pontibacter ramchanderi]PKV62395.1 hypothetical protein BD749_3879 [Pontibacter ramchanderi]